MKKWILPNDFNQDRIKEIGDAFNLHPYVAKILAQRGILENDKILLFLNPSLNNLSQPFLMKDLEKGAERVLTAIKSNENIAIHGDYDVDGVTATAILLDLLKRIGANVISYIPNRFDEGYGLSVSTIDELEEKGVKLIITVDCGITSIEAANRAKEVGIDLIITDHHEPKEILPEAYAVINPNQKGCNFPSKKLAGCGIAFYLAAIVKSLARKDESLKIPDIDMREYLDLVALGTIADVAQVLELNRIFIKRGLSTIETSNRVGISSLIEIAGLSGKKINYGNVAFQLAPRLNASGRISSAYAALSLLTTQNRNESDSLAKELDLQNKERQKIEEETIFDVLNKITEIADFDKRRTIVLGSEKWHPGVIGIVASRIVEKYGKPTILFSFKDGKGKGSGRSIEPFHLAHALSLSSHFLQTYGGHKQAAGATILIENFNTFATHFEEKAKELLTDDDLIPKLYIDSEIDFENISSRLINDLKLIEPFGPGNPRPIFITRNVLIREKKLINGKHLKLLLNHTNKNLSAIGFNRDDINAKANDKIDIAYFPKISHYHGLDSIELEIKDIRYGCDS